GSALTLRVLSRAWQMLLKGIQEAQTASRPLAAADMVLVRLAHAAELPTPDEALRLIRDTSAGSQAAAPAASARPAAPAPLASAPPAAAPAGGPVARLTPSGTSARAPAGAALRQESPVAPSVPVAPARPAAPPAVRLET